MAQYLQCLIKESGFSPRETEVLSRENDVIRFLFLHDHPRSSMEDRLEPGDREDRGLLCWSRISSFYSLRQNYNFQALCDDFYI